MVDSRLMRLSKTTKGWRMSIASLSGTLALTACAGHHPTDTLTAAVLRASEAMRSGDAESLHAMLDERLIVGTSVESLATSMKDDAAEFASLADGLDKPSSITVEATISLEAGQEMEFVLEDGAWKLQTPIVESHAAKDPLAALAILVETLRDVRADLIASGSLASQHEAGFLSLLEAMADQLSSVKAEELILSEDRCYITLGTGQKIELVREGDSWKVSSIFPPLQFP